MPRIYRSVLGKACEFINMYITSSIIGANHKARMYALPMLLCYGLFGVLIDLDHLIIQQMQRVRPLHLEYLICIWIVGLCYYAYAYRRINKDRMKMTILDEAINIEDEDLAEVLEWYGRHREFNIIRRN